MKVAFVVPIYPPDYKYGKRLIESYKQHHLDQYADLWFVFTNEEEAGQFNYWNHKIVLPKEVAETGLRTKGIINVKKFFAIDFLKRQYEYLVVIDSESLIIKEIDLYSVCETFYSKKVLYGNLTENDLSLIIDSSKKFFPEEKRKILDQYDDYYLWFNQLCIYQTSMVDDFLKKNHLLEKMEQIGPMDFDYIIWMYYLIVYHNWSVEKLPVLAPYGLLEGYKFLPQYFLKKHPEFKPYHCHKDLLELFSPSQAENIFIQIQLDIKKDNEIAQEPQKKINFFHRFLKKLRKRRKT